MEYISLRGKKIASVILGIYRNSGMENRKISVHCKETFQSLVVNLCTTRLNIKKLYIMSTECIYVFRIDLVINSKYIPMQH
jgi:hypothetical protein